MSFLVPTLARADVDPNLPCSPNSEFLRFDESEPSADFCAEWNPEFSFRGHKCCAKMPFPPRRKRRNQNRCSPQRAKASYCDEMTEAQRVYAGSAEAGELGDVLALISKDMEVRREQAYCTVNNGFLAYGRAIYPSASNRVKLRSPARCVNYGTDSMIGMIEWTGRQIATHYGDPKFENTTLLVGDISAPRGGCLSGRSGRRGHASHTSGQDVDLGFLAAKAGSRSPANFSRDFDAQANWWFIKQVFKNPFACVKVVFLDRRLINKLARVAAGDPDWLAYRRFIRHQPNHRNHWHIRIGDGPGLPGCEPGADPELEEESNDDDEADLPLEF